MKKHMKESKSYQRELDFDSKNRTTQASISSFSANKNSNKTNIISFSGALIEAKRNREDKLRRHVLQNTRSF